MADPIKDVSALHIADPERFAARWQAAMDAAVPLDDVLRAEADAARREAWATCEGLARELHILDKVADTVREAGLVGEERAVKLLYLAIISRFLDRPISIVVKGPSSGGKSYTVERSLAFFPPEAYYALSAMSERALAYDDEPLKHRTLVVYEAAGMAGETASYLMRSLLSEGCVRYVTVEKTKEGLRSRLIEREGPTGLIVTTTAARLHPENETRMFSLTVTDTREQTAAVLVALAGAGAKPLDYGAWHALQVWLAGGEHAVAIPYAPALAAAIPPVAVRLRRDFQALLGLIRSHAILHQATRGRDADGRIVATPDDYAVVRDLVADLFAEGVDATVPPAVRETVEAVRAVHKDAVSVNQVAAALALDKGTASRRVRRAIESGYLANLESRKGRPAQIAVGEPMPDDLVLLPEPESLCGAKDCAVAVLHGGKDDPSPPADDDGIPAWVPGEKAADDDN